MVKMTLYPPHPTHKQTQEGPPPVNPDWNPTFSKASLCHKMVQGTWLATIHASCSSMLAWPLFLHAGVPITCQKYRLKLTKVLQDVLKEFLWIALNVDTHSTWLFELVPLTPTVGSHKDTFGYMCGYVILQGTRSVPRFLQQQTRSYLPSLYPSAAHPIIWRAHFPTDIGRNLITWDNPQGKFIKSDLELTTSVLRHDCIAYFSDVLKKKNLSQANNISCMWWQIVALR